LTLNSHISVSLNRQQLILHINRMWSLALPLKSF
jgi:hypothetical protein